MMQPLLDDEAIECNPPSPVTGIQFIYKESLGSGGSLALRIHSLTECKYDEELSASRGDFLQRSSLFDINGIKSSDNPVRRFKSFPFLDEYKFKDNPYTEVWQGALPKELFIHRSINKTYLYEHILKRSANDWDLWYLRFIGPITVFLGMMVWFCCKRHPPPSFAIPMPAPPARDPSIPV